jgi:hypothetical protein
VFLFIFISLLEMSSVKKFRNSQSTANSERDNIVLDEAERGMVFGDFTAVVV